MSSLAAGLLQQEQNNGGSKSSADGAKETVANHVFTEAKTSVLLQTNIATVVNNENPEKSIQVRIIFDRGMFDSYVTRHVKESLNLPTIRKETLDKNVRFECRSASYTRSCASYTNGGRIQSNGSVLIRSLYQQFARH